MPFFRCVLLITLMVVPLLSLEKIGILSVSIDIIKTDERYEFVICSDSAFVISQQSGITKAYAIQPGIIVGFWESFDKRRMLESIDKVGPTPIGPVHSAVLNVVYCSSDGISQASIPGPATTNPATQKLVYPDVHSAVIVPFSSLLLGLKDAPESMTGFVDLLRARYPSGPKIQTIMDPPHPTPPPPPSPK